VRERDDDRRTKNDESLNEAGFIFSPLSLTTLISFDLWYGTDWAERGEEKETGG
jgi:hypothetical protein